MLSKIDERFSLICEISTSVIDFQKLSIPSSTVLPANLPKKDLNNIRNERQVAVSDTTEIQRNVRDCYEQLYANKLDNLEEMAKFLET